MKNPVLLFVLVLSLGLFAGGCKTAERIVETKDYDEAVSLLTKKLRGKKNKKIEYVQALELVLAKANARDLARAKSLESSGRGADWAKVHDIYKNVARRQSLIEPLLPLEAKNGYVATFKFIRTEPLLRESRDRSAAYYYDEAQKYMERARTGDKGAARFAYEKLERVGHYHRDYRNRTDLQREALRLGQVHVLVSMENDSRTLLPRRFEQDLMQMGIRDLESRWQTFHTDAHNRANYDYRIALRFTDIEVSPERTSERAYVDQREVEDGWEYQLDGNGNVAKDSLGNDIKVPRRITVRAEVLEIAQLKEAFVRGQLEFRDHTGRLLHREAIAGEAIFENYAATFRGDRRALSNESKSRINGSPVPFPTDEHLLLDTVESLRRVMKSKIRNNRVIV